jgi:thiamine biosynthesis lipoprotein
MKSPAAWIRVIIFWSILGVSVLFQGQCTRRQKDPELLTISGTTMGTIYRIKIPDFLISGRSVDPDSLRRGIENVLRDVNQKMSTYLENSEISRFNRFNGSDWFPVSRDTAWVIKRSIEVSEKSGGAFDITVGPLVNLWGFGPAKRGEIPDEREILKKLRNIGYKKINVRLSPPAVKKLRKNMFCDLSAIAKGYGVDRIAAYLDNQNVSHYLVEIGGELRVRGINHKKELWRIGIATPDDSFGIHKVIGLKDISMATSGDYRNYFEKDGIRYSHTIDPVTGRPITHTLASVTVISSSCLYSDAMATAINVLGPERGFDLAVKENLAAFLIIRAKKGFQVNVSPRFQKYLSSGVD